jgi:hypothetical protein
MDTNLSGFVYQQNTVCSEMLEDLKHIIYSEDVQADWLSLGKRLVNEWIVIIYLSKSVVRF